MAKKQKRVPNDYVEEVVEEGDEEDPEEFPYDEEEEEEEEGEEEESEGLSSDEAREVEAGDEEEDEELASDEEDEVEEIDEEGSKEEDEELASDGREEEEEESEEEDEELASDEEEDVQDENTKEAVIRGLIEPMNKDKLISILTEASATNRYIVNEIVKFADTDLVHRKIFVHGLGHDASNGSLISAFGSFGEIEDCRVIIDKDTGKSKGYGFVLFATRDAARKAVKQKQVMVGNWVASCNLAACKPSEINPSSDVGERKLYIANVGPRVSVQQLREFFAKYGEIEEGPYGVDRITGKFRGFAIVVYKAKESFRRAMEDPEKLFLGKTLLCSKADSGRRKTQTHEAGTGAFGVLPGSAIAPGNLLLPASSSYAAGMMNQGLNNHTLNQLSVLVGQNPSLAGLDSVSAAALSTIVNSYAGGSQPRNWDASALLAAYNSQAAMSSSVPYPGTQFGRG